MIASIHYETKYLRYFGNGDPNKPIKDEIVLANKL